ncbi:MAG TPA: RNA polymerase sigma factor [Flavobacteriia bacterium]|nr:RNA polymerase sigma factor [Flavobacteriia bacterium]
MEESKLIKDLKSANTKNTAFKKLVSLYKERLYWHIRKFVKLHEDADDILQNTFIKIFNNISNFNENAKLYTWMYRIATNEAINHLKKEAKLQYTDIDTILLDNVNKLDTDSYYNGTEIAYKLQQSIAKLPYKQQLVFNMKYFENLKYAEISEILETSIGALKASYHLAVKKIKKDIVTINHYE